MAFELLAVPERLLKRGDFAYFDGEWPKDWANRYFRVARTRQTVRDYAVPIQAGAGRYGMAPQQSIILNVETNLGLNPYYEKWFFQVRIGLNEGLYHVYPRWPSTEYGMSLQDPGFGIAPTDPDRRYIGFLDMDASRKDQPLFQFLWVKDTLPSFEVYTDGDATIPVYEKPVLRFLANMCLAQEVTEADALKALLSGTIPYFGAEHWSVLSWSAPAVGVAR